MLWFEILLDVMKCEWLKIIVHLFWLYKPFIIYFFWQSISKFWCLVVFTKVSSTPQEKWCYKHLHLIALWGILNQSHYFTNLNINFLLRTTIHIYHNIMLIMRRETSHFHLVTNEACFKSENWFCNEALFSLQNILVIVVPIKDESFAIFG